METRKFLQIPCWHTCLHINQLSPAYFPPALQIDSYSSGYFRLTFLRAFGMTKNPTAESVAKSSEQPTCVVSLRECLFIWNESYRFRLTAVFTCKTHFMLDFAIHIVLFSYFSRRCQRLLAFKLCLMAVKKHDRVISSLQN